MDSTKKKQLETFLYSAIGIAAVALILLAVNLIAAKARQRIDLTSENAYTLSPGTRAILAKLIRQSDPVLCTKNASAMPVSSRLMRNALRICWRIQAGFERPDRYPAVESRARFRCGDSAGGMEWKAADRAEKEFISAERRHARSEAAISFLTPIASASSIRHLAGDCARDDCGKARHRSDESAGGMGGANPMAMQMPQQRPQAPWPSDRADARFHVKKVELQPTKFPTRSRSWSQSIRKRPPTTCNMRSINLSCAAES